MEPDLVLYNGIVRTLDHRQPVSSAVAIWGDRIVALGDDDLRFAVSDAGVALDLGGRLVLPGFIDGHVHFVEFALRRRRLDLSGVTSLKAALQRVKAAVERMPSGQWMLGGGWDRNLWPDTSWPDKRSLDQISQLHPIALDSKDGHTLWANSLALERAGIDDSAPDPAGGKIIRWTATGEPTGILSEMPAKDLVRQVIEPPAPEVLHEAIREATETVWRAGVTGIHDCEDARALSALQELRRRGELGLRVLMHLDVNNLDAAIQTGIRTGLGDEWLRIGGVKIFMDGALGSRTAHMLEPHNGEPDNHGIVITTGEELAALLSRALPAGISVAIHAIGDAANRTVLDSLENALTRYRSDPSLRHRIEHAQILSPHDIPRLSQLDIIASVQPLHVTADYEMVERYWGAERGQGAYPFKTLLAAGTRLVFGSDCPIERCDPLGSIYAAVTRRRPDGSPGPAGWHPHERLSIEQALWAQCTEPAYAAGEETIKGTLIPGKLADMVILSNDIVAAPPEAILETVVHGTVIGGEIVYRSPA